MGNRYTFYMGGVDKRRIRLGGVGLAARYCWKTCFGMGAGGGSMGGVGPTTPIARGPKDVLLLPKELPSPGR